MTLPDHLFVSAEGHLFDTRDPDWSKKRPLRPCYAQACESIETLAEVKANLRAGAYTFPGGYPRFFSTRDGAALSFDAARSQFAQVCDDFMADASTGWRIDTCIVNYEDDNLVCDHTNLPIPSAYGEDAA